MSLSVERLEELVGKQVEMGDGYDAFGAGSEWRAVCEDSASAIRELIAIKEDEPAYWKCWESTDTVSHLQKLDNPELFSNYTIPVYSRKPE